MKKLIILAAFAAALTSLAACGPTSGKGKCSGEGGVCRIGDEKRKEAIRVASYCAR